MRQSTQSSRIATRIGAKILGSSLFCLLIATAGCQKRETPPVFNQAQLDSCSLITKEEVQGVVGSPVKETKNSLHSDQGLRMSHCFYTAAEFTKSVSVMVTVRDPDSPAKRSPKDFWKERLGQENAHPEKERSVPPKKIDGLGDEAYWTGIVSATLYVLKKDAFIRISVGGPDNEEEKLRKSKVLAEKALKRL